MEQFKIDKDIKTFYIQADSFPLGIKPAFQKLHSLVASAANRQFFGISYMEGPGNIIYKAAAGENYEGEAEELKCETFIIRKGNYISIYIKDFMKDISSIGKAFDELLQDPNIDPTGYCLEIYEGMSNVRCLVGLKP